MPIRSHGALEVARGLLVLTALLRQASKCPKGMFQTWTPTASPSLLHLIPRDRTARRRRHVGSSRCSSFPDHCTAGEEMSHNWQAGSFNTHFHGASSSVPSLKKNNKPHYNCRMEVFDIRHVSPIMHYSSNNPAGKQSIAAFPLILPLLIFLPCFQSPKVNENTYQDVW